MNDPEKLNSKTVRARPSQARGKERVRQILKAALDLFKAHGVDDVTTNDIAKRAGVPIGSLYRYYPNKESIIVALTELYAEDISKVFEKVSKRPNFKKLPLNEVMELLVDGWVQYSRTNGPFTFLYAEQASPKLYRQNQHSWAKLAASLGAALKKRCPDITPGQIMISFGLLGTGAAMGVNENYKKIAGEDVHKQASQAVAAYLEAACR
jgi:AcrR family transcriptional regulator